MKKLFPMFYPAPVPTVDDLVRAELNAFERELLFAETRAAYHAKMAEYYREGIVRLQSRAS